MKTQKSPSTPLVPYTINTRDLYTKYRDFQQNRRSEPISEEPSLTVPDQAMPLRQILERYAMGQELPFAHNIYYDGENPSFEDYDETKRGDFDLSDVSRIQNEIERNKLIRKEEADEKRSAEEAKKVEDQQKKAQSVQSPPQNGVIAISNAAAQDSGGL